MHAFVGNVQIPMASETSLCLVPKLGVPGNKLQEHLFEDFEGRSLLRVSVRNIPLDGHTQRHSHLAALVSTYRFTSEFLQAIISSICSTRLLTYAKVDATKSQYIQNPTTRSIPSTNTWRNWRQTWNTITSCFPTCNAVFTLPCALRIIRLTIMSIYGQD